MNIYIKEQGVYLKRIAVVKDDETIQEILIKKRNSLELSILAYLKIFL